MDEQRDYPPPLERLCRAGDPRDTWQWEQGNPDYVKQFGLGPEHIPVLIEIARQWVDDEDRPKDDVIYAPVHAWRALGQLRAIEAVKPLLAMQNAMDNLSADWYLEEFSEASSGIALKPPHCRRRVGPLGRKTVGWRNGGGGGRFSHPRALPFARANRRPFGARTFEQTRDARLTSSTSKTVQHVAAMDEEHFGRTPAWRPNNMRAEGPGVLRYWQGSRRARRYGIDYLRAMAIPVDARRGF